MSTFLFDSVIFGPVKSRRLGNSLGINLLPMDSKFCNYNCVYCECGWSSKNNKAKLPSYTLVIDELQKFLENDSLSKTIDVITFAGNGEPSLHPDFTRIISETIKLRNKYVPNVKIAVLTNATRLDRVEIVSALKDIDLAILKIDTVIQEDYTLINQPNFQVNIETIVNNIIKNFSHPVIQTMFFQANIDGKQFDNTQKQSLDLYLKVLKKISPELVMIYSIARDTPMQGLSNISIETLESIGEKIKGLGFETLITP